MSAVIDNDANLPEKRVIPLRSKTDSLELMKLSTEVRRASLPHFRGAMLRESCGLAAA